MLCTPTRAALISGRYQQRYRPRSSAAARAAPTPDRRAAGERGHSLPQLLKDAGYATALIGKWHLGYRRSSVPNAHGFEYFFGLKSGFHDYYGTPAATASPDLWENDAPVEVHGLHDRPDHRARGAVHRAERRPAVLHRCARTTRRTGRISRPIGRRWRRGNARHLHAARRRPTSTRADYVAMVERVDRGVGEILRALDRLRPDATTRIVIFTNDNGGEWLSNNGPLFNRKWTVWEGGIRVPALIRWPGRIPAGKVSAQVGITMDLTASILAATGRAVPPEARHEGMNLFPIWRARRPEVDAHAVLAHERRRPNAARPSAAATGSWCVDGDHRSYSTCERTSASASIWRTASGHCAESCGRCSTSGSATSTPKRSLSCQRALPARRAFPQFRSAIMGNPHTSRGLNT